MTQAGYQVMVAADERAALQRFAEHPIDFVLLNAGVRGMDSYALCSELRKRTAAPILFLFAAWTPLDKRVLGIELGADGYLTRPFTVAELHARVHALLTRVRKSAATQSSLMVGGLHLDEWKREVSVRGQTHHITPQEFHLLRYLMSHPDRQVAKEELLNVVWPVERHTTPEDDYNRLRVTISRLRLKIEEDPDHPRYLKTVPGVGYQFCSGSPG
jgi:DNA-binding response OmpR family regulator